MTRIVPGAAGLPPRPPDGRALGSQVEIFAAQASVNMVEWLRNLERRVEAIENRVSRIYAEGSE